MKGKSDKELFQAMRSGDEYAFQSIFNRHWQPLLAFVCKLISDEDQAKDIVQNAFIEIWHKKETLLVQDSLMPYLTVITKNEVMSLFRKDKIRLAGDEILIANLKRVNHPDEHLIAGELQSAIDTELVKMPSNMRQCFQLSRYEQKSIRDIANELMLSEQTVKNNISEALRRLRNHLTSYSSGHLA
ncbi:MAG TPA: RNA polymerase sigma-70 factor [Pedobacter sp.]|uniref:RNA polymerase sigma factor n=1 Tax=Pedobacter sp. TaxID=1411316 RepID=UPI002CC1BE26|nr:RNA polymerase sigma-70 factor [Pedobacter sp.]HMI01081.1 RNA polymerase sigma-70 factor [Pedobacter sp.]